MRIKITEQARALLKAGFTFSKGFSDNQEALVSALEPADFNSFVFNVLECWNWHAANDILLVKKYGTATEVQQIEKAQAEADALYDKIDVKFSAKLNEKRDKLLKKRYEIARKYYGRLAAADVQTLGVQGLDARDQVPSYQTGCVADTDDHRMRYVDDVCINNDSIKTFAECLQAFEGILTMIAERDSTGTAKNFIRETAD